MRRQQPKSAGRPDREDQSIPPEIDWSRIPAHVACVMDGNGRWASQRGLPRTDGHAAGEEALVDAIDGALALGIEWITMYAFSTENWRRPVDEVRYLMGFNESLLMRRRDELNEKGVRIRFAGRRDWRVPKRVLRRMDEASELTKDNRRCTLTMAFNYGGRAEIIDAVRSIVAEGVKADKIDERLIAKHLYYPDMPDPDLVVLDPEGLIGDPEELAVERGPVAVQELAPGVVVRIVGGQGPAIVGRGGIRHEHRAGVRG